MNYSRVILSTILIAVAASAQTPIKSPPAPGVTVTQISWRKEAFVPALYDDPLARNQEHTDLEREQKATIRQNVIRAQSGQLPLPIPTRPASSTRPGLSAVYYRYEAKVSNTSQKTIREIVWEYSLSEPETEVQIGCHQYTSKVSLRPGKIATLIGLSNTPPNGVVLVDKAGDKLQSKYVERVVIRRIEFGDGTFWERPVN